MIKSKVLIIIPNLGRGGAQRVFHQQLRYLSAWTDVVGCVFNWDGSFLEDHVENIISLDVPAGRSVFDKIYYFYLRIYRLRKIKCDQKITICISHLEGADYVNLLSRTDEKVVCWIHGTKQHDKNISGFLGFLRFRFLMPILYKRADRIVCVSKGIEQELKRNITLKNFRLRTIYNGFDLDMIRLKSSEKVDPAFLSVANNYRIIVTHCRLSNQKNLGALLHIFKKLDRRDCKLVIIGDGELLGELLELSRTLQLKTWDARRNEEMNSNHDVYFLGHQDNPFKFLSLAYLFAMTSGWEGFPLALCEAIACGLPVIASDCFTGPREILQPDLKEPQPISKAYDSKFGTLMPIPDAGDNRVLDLWKQEINRLLNQKRSADHVADTQARIADFGISNSNKQTTHLIEELKYDK